MGYIGYSAIYYIVYFVAGLFFAVADKTIGNKRTKQMIALGILVLCAFAGIRSLTVGTDTATVVHYRFDNAKLYSSWRTILTPGNESFLTLIGWIIRRTINDYRVYLFVLQLLFEIPIGIIAYKLREKIDIAGLMAVFMLMFFQVSLNIHKQSIAAAWLLLAVLFFREKKIIPAVLLTLFATLFHGSVFMGVALFVAVYILSSSNKTSVRIIVLIVALVTAIMVFMNWRSIATFILSSERLTDDYTSYLAIIAGESGQRYTSFHYKTYISIFLRFVGIIMISRSYLGSPRRYDPDIRFFMYCTAVGFLIYGVFSIAFHMYIGDRFTMYLDISQIVLIPMLAGKSDSSKLSSKNTPTILIPKAGPRIIYIYYFMYNFAYYMIVNYGKTLPYRLG